MREGFSIFEQSLYASQNSLEVPGHLGEFYSGETALRAV
jgi:hypothetical protein